MGGNGIGNRIESPRGGEMTTRKWLWAAAVAVVVALGIAYAANDLADPQGGQQHWGDVVNGTRPT
jgi:hypothetical protein